MELQVGSSNYEVFISFRGKDTRNNFVGHLHKALKHRGIHAFIDSEDLWEGEDIGAALLKAIKNSKLSIAVLSERYTESSWCLRELTQILECHKADGQIIFPIFFKVNTSNVKNQTGCFEISPKRHRKEAPETLQRWKQTLRAIGDKSGWVFNNGDDESKLVENIVQKTWIRMNIVPLINIKNPVGLESRVESVLSLLSNTSNIGSRDVQFIGICGQGGMGKTTIASVVYNCIAKLFSKSCFIGDVREKASRTNGTACLQEELLHGIFRTETKICSFQEGSRLIKARLQNMKTLLILDDVGDRTQLDALARDLNWFGSGSKIIVTTRDQSVLGGVPKNCRQIFEPWGLNTQESIQLFCLNAFSTEEPPKGYKDLSVNIARTTGGLPLALEVLGCDLSMVEDKEVWESKSRMLEKLPDDTVYEKLKTTFDDLHDIEKSMFLDAACFFIGWKMKTIIPIWEACGFEPICRLEVLKRKSLLRIQMPSNDHEDDTLWIHDQIRDMGRRIAYNQRPENPNYHSRLWSRDNIMKGCKGNEIAEGIVSDLWDFKEACFCMEVFEKMRELRLLEVNRAILKGNFQCLPSQLRWLSWRHCPLEKLPDDFYLEELVALDLTEGRFIEAWKKWPQNKSFQQLKVLTLKYCNLSESPDFSGFPRLEKLDLSDSSELVHLHESVGELKQLVFLDLTNCRSLRKLPNSLCRLSSLQQFSLERCSSLVELPDNIGRLSSLQSLDLGNCDSLKDLPISIGALHSLQKLELSYCDAVKELPSSISDLKETLTELSVRGMNIEALPYDIVLLKKLEVLDLSNNRQLVHLPKSMVTMTSLRDLNLSGCIKLLCIPMLPSHLIRFIFKGRSHESIPYIYNMKNLKIIKIGVYNVMVEKFRGFPETSSIGDEFNELISKLGRSCCVVTIPNCSRQTQVHQETIPRDISTESRRQIWVPLQQKTAEEGCKCTINIGSSWASSNFCGCSWVTGSRYFCIPKVDETSSSSSSSSSSRLVMHVSLGVYQIGDLRYQPGPEPPRCIRVDVAACIHSKDNKTEYKVRLGIGGTIKSNRPGGHLEFIHEFEGFDWFGVPLEGGDTIEVTRLNPNPTWWVRTGEYAQNLMGYSLRAVNLFLLKESADDECHSSYGDHDRFLQIVRCPRTRKDDQDITSDNEEEMTFDLGETQNRVAADNEDIVSHPTEEEDEEEMTHKMGETQNIRFKVDEMTHEAGETQQNKITQYENYDGDRRTKSCCCNLSFSVKKLFFAAS